MAAVINPSTCPGAFDISSHDIQSAIVIWDSAAPDQLQDVVPAANNKTGIVVLGFVLTVDPATLDGQARFIMRDGTSPASRSSYFYCRPGHTVSHFPAQGVSFIEADKAFEVVIPNVAANLSVLIHYYLVP